MAWKVLIPDRSITAEIEQAVFGATARCYCAQATRASDISDAAWRSADAILLWHEVHLDAARIATLGNCRVIVRVGTGFDNVDVRAAAARGIPVCNVPDYGTNDVADHAMALALALSRGLIAYDRAARRSEWTWQAAGDLTRITGRTLGIVGLGRIGTATALRAKAFGMDVVFFDPYKDDGYDKALGIERAECLEDLLERANVVSIHTPLTDATRALAGTAFFTRMKPGGIFINVARGGCMDLDALHEALRRNRLRAAGLDVLPDEPPELGHPLIAAWRNQESWLEGRLLITPHAAFFNRESHEEMRRKAAEEALRVLRGDAPRNCVNGNTLAARV